PAAKAAWSVVVSPGRGSPKAGVVKVEPELDWVGDCSGATSEVPTLPPKLERLSAARAMQMRVREIMSSPSRRPWHGPDPATPALRSHPARLAAFRRAVTRAAVRPPSRLWHAGRTVVEYTPKYAFVICHCHITQPICRAVLSLDAESATIGRGSSERLLW